MVTWQERYLGKEGTTPAHPLSQSAYRDTPCKFPHSLPARHRSHYVIISPAMHLPRYSGVVGFSHTLYAFASFVSSCP